ncbi:hypothetical protein CEXT_58301 [Caerostris extrusa]|uniref:Uncharacterized protein n=1 Tax=Caerostris extrusa TaxID=172846 RepID=A0AAV4RYL7_CAEEX|nr:hypothetical protein CEXT_58301 [Caerostris extrusa]
MPPSITGDHDSRPLLSSALGSAFFSAPARIKKRAPRKTIGFKFRLNRPIYFEASQGNRFWDCSSSSAMFTCVCLRIQLKLF